MDFGLQYEKDKHTKPGEHWVYTELHCCGKYFCGMCLKHVEVHAP